MAHGYVRFTADIDLMLEMSDANLRQALDILAALGFAPRAPVKMELFADEYEKG